MFSDFNKTTGPDPARAAQLFRAAKTKIYTVGVGATQAVNLTARIVAAPYAKTKEEAPITVVLQPTGLGGQTTRVRLYAEPLGGGSGSRTLIGEKPAYFRGGRNWRTRRRRSSSSISRSSPDACSSWPKWTACPAKSIGKRTWPTPRSACWTITCG